jgi:hypothetical protein
MRFLRCMDDNEFVGLRSVLDGKMKELSKKQADIVTEEYENMMWDKAVLGMDNPKQLLDTLVYSIGLNFTLRRGQKHRN